MGVMAYRVCLVAVLASACARASNGPDGEGNGDSAVVDCDQDGDGHDAYACEGDDCDDGDATVQPGAQELCNGHDDDCDGEDRYLRPWYEDGDGDGYGNVEKDVVECYPPSGYVEAGTDCDDANPDVSPGVPELCDNDIDDDCDGVAAVGADDDGDGFVTDECTDGDDCDDTDADIHVGASEVCGDGIDSDCNGLDLFCGYVGDHDLAEADATLQSDPGSSDAGRLVEAGDVTGDGKDDVFLATLYGDGGAGGGYIAAGPVTGDVALLEGGFRISSDWDTAGASRSIGLGDANGDGIDDVSFGAPYGDDNGQYIVFGPITAGVDLADDSDAWLTGRSGTYCAHGSDLGDLDDDGYEDAAIGAYFDSSGAHGSGTLFVEFGPLSGHVDLETDADVEIAGVNANAYVGRMVHAGKDINGDGLGDFAANAVYDSTGGPGAGGLYVVYGPASIESLDDAGGFLVGEGANAQAGAAFTVGDYDGDGLADVAASSSVGYGAVAIAPGPASGEIDLSTVDTIIEGESMGQQLGSGLGSGDVDGDGTDELLIGAPGDRTCGNMCGAAFLVFAPPSGTWDVSDAAQASFWGAFQGDQSGQGVAIGDLDADGFGELIIGGPGIGSGGGAYVVFPTL
jgi:hypothetical protein